ncbi:MAG TPA: secretin N-terminal domain-containing protein, partial [Phycisphaerae bacterium]|nr:secretin N-terminal domain-containing protein [Phycisphaerae bacterium]
GRRITPQPATPQPRVQPAPQRNQPANQPQRPRGGQGGARGGGVWLMPRSAAQPIGAEAADDGAAGVAGGRPLVATTLAAPSVMAMLLAQDAAAGAPPASQPQPEPRGISGTLQGRVVATPLDGRRLIVTGTRRDIEFIRQMLTVMEATSPQPVVEVFPLEYSKATTLQQVVDQLLRSHTEQTGGADRFDRYIVIAEGRSNSLIVSANEKSMELARVLIAELDRPDIESLKFRTVQLLNLQAAEAVGLVTPMIEAMIRLQGDTAEMRPSVQAVNRINAVLIQGTQKDVEEIERLLAAVDVPLAPDAAQNDFIRTDVMIVTLENAIAEDVATVLDNLIEVDRSAGGTGAGGAAGGAGAAQAGAKALVRILRLIAADGKELPDIELDKPIRIVADKGSNSLMVLSTPKNNVALREVIGVFDSLPRGAEVDVKSITLRHAAAATVAELLTTVFEQGLNTLKRPADMAGTGFERG